MEINMKKRLMYGTICLLCTVVSWRYSLVFIGTEFSGGKLTGALLTLHVIGSFLFVVSLIVTFKQMRIATVGGLLASIFCIPLYLYFTIPYFFQRIFPGLYSVKYKESFVWNVLAIIWILVLVTMMFFCVNSFSKK